MPASISRQARTLSPPLSTTSYSYTPTISQQRLNVVTRLSIEGKSKRGWDGAAIKMYLKISLPLDSITPGATIALFPEENLKILDSQVHPLTSDSVPYSFSTTTCPLLRKAARALNLPARSSTSYVPDPMASSFASSASLPPLEDKYTGHILVSGYHVSYILPKEFPRKERESNSRRGTTNMLFMAAIDIWVPFVSKPPQAPFLLSIPLPRCLSNHIRLHIFSRGQSSMASSLASLSSADEDAGAWEFASEPHVTRSASARLARTPSINNFADDESSDASMSAGFPEGAGIQGTFPSAERIRLRWATPLNDNAPSASDGRHRVGIRDVKADMTAVILGSARKGNGREGVLMNLEYSATCKGAWFPGVATMLGMDVGLEAGDYDVAWASDEEPRWTVSGGPGFTGFAINGPPHTSRQSPSDPSSSVYVLPSSPDAKGVVVNGRTPLRQNSTTSSSSGASASLLHAPLPNQNVADYSFESSPVSTPTGTVSSLASLGPPSSPERRRRSHAPSTNNRYIETTDTDPEPEMVVRAPAVPITVHLNMNELLPPSKNAFTFRISGMVIVTPRTAPPTPNSRRSSPSRSRSRASSLSDSEPDIDPLPIPRFRVLFTDKESTNTVVRNETKMTVDVYNSVGSLREGRGLKTPLLKGNHLQCGMDSARISLRTGTQLNSSPITPSRKRTTYSDSDDEPCSRSHMRSVNDDRSLMSAARPRDPSMSMVSTRIQPPRDGPLMIPSVSATVTPLLAAGASFQHGYAVQLTLPAPSDGENEWLEFGLALPSAKPSSSSSGEKGTLMESVVGGPPRVEIASASVEGVPVRFQTGAVAKPTGSTSGVLTLPFEEMSGKEWISWVSVHVGPYGGGKVEVVYIVKAKVQKDEDIKEDEDNRKRKGKQKEVERLPLDVLLPSFAIPVGRLEVDVRVQSGYEVTFLHTNLMHQETTSHGRRLLQYSLVEYFYPRLSMQITPASAPAKPPSPTRISWNLVQLLWILVPIAVVIYLYRDLRIVNAELYEMRRSLAKLPVPESDSLFTPGTITVTATVTADDRQSTVANPFSSSKKPAVAASSHKPSLESSVSLIPPFMTVTTATSTPTFSVESDPDEEDNLITDPPFSWPPRLDFSQIHLPPLAFEIPETARASMEAVLNSVDVMWRFFQKVLHFPLNPP